MKGARRECSDSSTSFQFCSKAGRMMRASQKKLGYLYRWELCRIFILDLPSIMELKDLRQSVFINYLISMVSCLLLKPESIVCAMVASYTLFRFILKLQVDGSAVLVCQSRFTRQRTDRYIDLVSSLRLYNIQIIKLLATPLFFIFYLFIGASQQIPPCANLSSCFRVFGAYLIYFGIFLSSKSLVFYYYLMQRGQAWFELGMRREGVFVIVEERIFFNRSRETDDKNNLIFMNRINHFFSFFPVKRATSEIPLTAITLNLIPGISPFDLPFLPKPATKTQSFSARQFKQPSHGTKAATFLLFL